MGDRTSVILTVLKEHAEEAKRLIKPEEGDPYDECEEDDLIELRYDQVNYGTIDALEGFVAAGIPYVFSWDPGGCYSEGCSWLRFDAEGNAILGSSSPDWPEQILTDFREQILEASSVEEVLKILNQSIDSHTWGPWDNQLEHSKIARARNLINPPLQ